MSIHFSLTQQQLEHIHHGVIFSGILQVETEFGSSSSNAGTSSSPSQRRLLHGTHLSGGSNRRSEATRHATTRNTSIHHTLHNNHRRIRPRSNTYQNGRATNGRHTHTSSDTSSIHHTQHHNHHLRHSPPRENRQRHHARNNTSTSIPRTQQQREIRPGSNDASQIFPNLDLGERHSLISSSRGRRMNGQRHNHNATSNSFIHRSQHQNHHHHHHHHRRLHPGGEEVRPGSNASHQNVPHTGLVDEILILNDDTVLNGDSTRRMYGQRYHATSNTSVHHHNVNQHDRDRVAMIETIRSGGSDDFGYVPDTRLVDVTVTLNDDDVDDYTILSPQSVNGDIIRRMYGQIIPDPEVEIHSLTLESSDEDSNDRTSGNVSSNQQNQNQNRHHRLARIAIDQEDLIWHNAIWHQLMTLTNMDGPTTTTYEELSNLGEQIGAVETGLSEDIISQLLETRSTNCDNLSQGPEICIVCQDEYKTHELIGRLDCGHEYHATCIKSWLLRKNVCPICKRKGLNGRNPSYSI